MDTSQGDEGDVNAPVVKLLQLPEPVLVSIARSGCCVSALASFAVHTPHTLRVGR